MSKTHDLKTQPKPFRATLRGRKKAEFRPDDFDPPVEVGDTLLLREWDPAADSYSGLWAMAQVTKVEKGPPGYCLISHNGVWNGGSGGLDEARERTRDGSYWVSHDSWKTLG